MLNSKTNKQAGTIKGADELTEGNAELFRIALKRMYETQERLYQEALQIGVPKELARVHVGVGRYSRMRASANLRNWLAFLTLRMDPAAAWEIRQYANAVGDLIQVNHPKTWELFSLSLAKWK
jgi:thymidylate synthase (FAD)